MTKKIVLALGGNALIRRGEYGTVYEQFANARKAVDGITELIKQGHKLAITHGNGPQVGNIMIRTEAALDKAYYIPLGVAVAESQGEIGYMLEQTIQNELKQNRIKRNAVCLLTQVICDKKNPKNRKPSKPIGPFYSKKEMLSIRKKEKKISREKIEFVEDAGRGFRRIVPSPIPKDIVEKKVIQKLMNSKDIVIACGGGGMPVYKHAKRGLEGIDGVVDKDRASALLASQIKADELIILTTIENVCLNFGQKNEMKLSRLSLKDAEKYLKEGQFPEGSMGPKIESAISFLKKGGKRVIITSIDKLMPSLQGKAGTVIQK